MAAESPDKALGPEDIDDHKVFVRFIPPLKLSNAQFRELVAPYGAIMSGSYSCKVLENANDDIYAGYASPSALGI